MTKTKEYDFSGNQIKDPENQIKIKSVCSIHTQNEKKTNLIPYGDFDINDSYVTGNYFYHVRIVDEDKDGLLLEDDYKKGELWRVNRKTLKQEFCFKIEPYNFHRFITANDSYIVFASEDNIPNTTEIVFYHLQTKQISVLNNIYEQDWYDFRVVNNNKGEPEFFIFKRDTDDDHKDKKTSSVRMMVWSELIAQLHWK